MLKEATYFQTKIVNTFTELSERVHSNKSTPQTSSKGKVSADQPSTTTIQIKILGLNYLV